jgi:hypothetical protein
VAKENSIPQTLISMQQPSALDRLDPSAQVATVSKDVEAGLSVATVYQDPLTRQWAAELWDRVVQLINDQGVRCQSWKISELTDHGIFLDSVQVAAEADVLIVSVRDAGELPISLYVWMDALLPSRARRAGALVALIGVPPQPDTQSGKAHQYLESVARKAGLDFLPHERKLPEQPFALSGPAKIGQTSSPTTPLAAGAFSAGPRAHLHCGLIE